ncbi:replication protein [Paenibacillus sp. NPDC058177]|uniref:replication protein n=1 Tax=Paenibacillus sp. NPDC058177 TaxID=3346369 RepID=UPI0036D90413
MANPQKGNGYVGVSNEIWDEIIRRDFTKRQKDIIMLIVRLSYGCNRKVALIPKQQDFGLCGLGGKGHIGVELKFLERCNVILRGPNKSEYSLNKNYEMWEISPVKGWEGDRFNELVYLNIMESKKDKNVTESGASNLLNPHDRSSRNGNNSEDEKLPFQEHNDEVKVTDSGTSQGKKFLKQEPQVPETGTSIASNPLPGADYSVSKYSLNTIKIKDNKEYINDWLTFYKIKSRGIFDLERAYSYIGVLEMDLIELYMKKSQGKSVPYFETIAKNSIADNIVTLAAWKQKNEKSEPDGRLDFINNL